MTNAFAAHNGIFVPRYASPLRPNLLTPPSPPAEGRQRRRLLLERAVRSEASYTGRLEFPTWRGRLEDFLHAIRIGTPGSMSLNVLPSLPPDNAAHGAPTDWKVNGNLFVGKVGRCCQPSYFTNIVIRKLGSMLLHSVANTALYGHIMQIVSIGSDPKVGWIDALRVVAGVAQDEAFGHLLTGVDEKRNMMGAHPKPLLKSEGEVAVA